MLIALCQINSTVGDLAGNRQLMEVYAGEAARRGADLAVFPELALTGYPPRDLVDKPSFIDRSIWELKELAKATAHLRLGLVAGYVSRAPEGSPRAAMNSAALVEGGKVRFTQSKMLLPAYDVFDESRNFQSATSQEICEFRGVRLALTICEDAWNDNQFWQRPLYKSDPVEDLVGKGASLIVSINGSPFHMHKRGLRRGMFAAIARRHHAAVVYVNMTGGNDQLVFDGSSFALNSDGEVAASARSFAEDIVLYDTDRMTGEIDENLADETEAVYEALVMGTRDYVKKCGFQRVLIGLSGGVDSTLVAAVAVDAVGASNVTGVAMPGPYSSDHSLTDARELAANLGMRFEVAPINDAYRAMADSLEPLFAGAAPDVTEENIQARLRGVTLMSLSNKWGAMVLTTGNKSETAVGYCTLYGDMAGGLAVISDVPKTMVYELCRVVNRRRGPVIPQNIFTKPPSAELRPDQKDSDSLPEYAVLDVILKSYIEELKAPAEIAHDSGQPLELVKEIARKVDVSEYKRQQAAPGLKVTTKAFGIGRRFPIAQKFKD
ncbi:MAG: NAD+ synthase [Candidatus Solibacter sp.]|nr:NAD+ synthase [Candidatus Solibacter sp.]